MAVSSMMLLLVVCCSHAQTKRNRPQFKRVLVIDTLHNTNGETSYSIQYTDIIVHVTDNGWIAKDSTLFYSERTKVEWASKILLDQISQEKDSLSHFVDSAGARVGRGALRKGQVDSVTSKMETDIQQKIATQEYALKRLEDYRHVSEAVEKILKR